MSLVYKSLSVSCFNRQLQLWVIQHGSLGSIPLSSWLGQMLRVTSKVVEGASRWGKQKCFTDQDWSLQLKNVAAWKRCHLWLNHMNICGLQHFASVWKDILVSLKGVTTKPMFCEFMGGIFCEWNWDKITYKTHKNTQSQSNTIAHTQYTQTGGDCMRKWEGFASRVKTKQGWGLGLADCFLKCKGANV